MRIVVIGAGPGGYVAALRAAQRGADVVVVEDDEVGGTCLNWGCIPTKTLLASAEVFARTKEADTYGVRVEGEVAADLGEMMTRKDRVVATQVKGIRALFKSWGIRLVAGRGRLAGRTSVAVAGEHERLEMIEGDRILIATGSRPAGISGVPFDGVRVISSNEAVGLREIPRRLLIVGAGAIGCEFAFLFRELGAEVTLLEVMPRILGAEDEEIAALLEREMRKKKIHLMTGTTVARVEAAAGGVTVYPEGKDPVEADLMLVAAGRVANTEGLGLREAGVRTGPRGEIVVNEYLETGVEGIYAVGDVTGGAMLAHVASKEGCAAVDNMLGDRTHIRYDVVPAAVFTRPEIGSVGLREFQARERGLSYRVGRFPFRGLGRAHAMGEIGGMIKILAEGKTDRVLGAHIIGAHAADLVHEAALAMEVGATVGQIAGMIHAHPCLPEGLMAACEDAGGLALHAPRPAK